MNCHVLLHGIFLTQGWNPGLLCLVTQSSLTLCDPMDCSPPGSSVHGILHARILEWVAMSSSKGSSQPRDKTQTSHIACRFFTAESQGKPKNTGVGSLSLLQGIFPTQGSNPGLQHCRQILYHLSHHNLLRNITHHSTPNIFFYQCDECFIKNTIISFKLG